MTELVKPAMNGLALDLDEIEDQTEWEAIGERIQQVDVGIQWAIGDWVNYGVLNYQDGLDVASKILTHHGPDAVTRYADVAAAFEPDRRRPNLSFSHHAKIMSLMLVQQDALLDEAAAGDYTVREIEQRRNEIRTGVKDVSSELTGGMTRDEIEQERERQRVRSIEHRRMLHDIGRRVGEKAADVRVPRDVYFQTILPKFKEPKGEPIEATAR